jgi:hypothetical protein
MVVGYAYFDPLFGDTTYSKIYETTNLGRADSFSGGQPTWTDITPTASGSIPSFWVDESTTPETWYAVEDGWRVWTRQGTGSWSQYLTYQDYSQTWGVWQTTYDPNGAFPSCDSSVHYTPNGEGYFIQFVGKYLYFLSHPGSACVNEPPLKMIARFDITTIGDWTEIFDLSAHPFGGVSMTPHAVHNPLESEYSDFFAPQESNEYQTYRGATGVRNETSLKYYTQGDSYDSNVVWLWANGIGGKVYKSTDGGSTRVQITGTSTITATDSFYGLHMVSLPSQTPQEIYIMKGMLDVSVTDVSGTINALHFIQVYKSEDGGTTWTTKNGRYFKFGSLTGINGIYAPTGGGFLVAVGNAGKVYISNDDGLTWWEKGQTLTSLVTRPYTFVWVDPDSTA